MSSQDDHSDTTNDNNDAPLPTINEAGSDSGVSIEQLEDNQLPDTDTGQLTPPTPPTENLPQQRWQAYDQRHMTEIPETSFGIPDATLGAQDTYGNYHLSTNDLS